MGVIGLDHWIINGNKLRQFIKKYYVIIDLVNNDGEISFVLQVSKGIGTKQMSFSFQTLEEAVTFTENIIKKSDNFDDIENKYHDNKNNDSREYIKKYN